MPSDFVLKSMNAVHRTILTATFGKVGWKVGGMPALELTTIGRKSGERRTVMLTVPAKDGDALVIVASRGGDDKPPAWLLNLQANSTVEVSLQGGAKQPMNARVATAQERARLWPEVIRKYKNYAGYQKKTEREIPLVLLTTK